MRFERHILVAVFVVATFCGCATPPIAKSLRQQARPLTLEQVAANPVAYRGVTVIWGGSIIDTVNDTNGGAVYVLELPLSGDEKPVLGGISSGRFIARSSRFLDPEMFPHGWPVTVAGKVQGQAIEPVQQTTYAYPVLTIEQICTWPPQETGPYYEYGPYPYWPYWGWWWWGFYPGWGWGWYPGHYHGGYHGGGHWGGGAHYGGGGGGWHGR